MDTKNKERHALEELAVYKEAVAYVDAVYKPNKTRHYVVQILQQRIDRGLEALAQPTPDTITLPSSEWEAMKRDAELFQAIASEFDNWHPNKPRPNNGQHMPIWTAMCNAVGDGVDGNGLRAAIDIVIKEDV